MTRLYTKYELTFAFNSSNKYFDKLMNQYNYAKENIESLRKASGGAASTLYSGGSGG